MVSQTPTSTKNNDLRNNSVSDLCRICMLPGDYFKNSSHEITTRICKMIKTSTQIDVTINDGYPQILCSNCYKQLYESYKFVLLAKNTQKELRKSQPTDIIKEKFQIFESKVNTISPIKENIDLNSNSNIDEQKKNTNNDLAKIKNSTPNKDNVILNKRQVLRSSLKKEDVIIIENNNSIDLTNSPLEENSIPIQENTTTKREPLSPTTSDTPPIEKKRKLNDRKTKTKEIETKSNQTLSPNIIDNTIISSETLLENVTLTNVILEAPSNPVKKRRIYVKKPSKVKETEIKTEETIPENPPETVLVTNLGTPIIEIIPVEKKRRSIINDKNKSNKIDLTLVENDKISIETQENVNVSNPIPIEEINIKVDKDLIEESSILKENDNTINKKVLTPKNLSASKQKNRKKKNDDINKLVQTSIASFYTSPKKELLSPNSCKSENDIQENNQVIVSNDKKTVIDLTELNDIQKCDNIPQKVSEKRKRSSELEILIAQAKISPMLMQNEVEVSRSNKSKKIVSKKTVIVSSKNETKLTKKKGKKTFIKINTKYLTRTFKSKDKKIVKEKKVLTKTPKLGRKKRNVSIKEELPKSDLDDILSAVGLVRKKSNSDLPEKYVCEICHMKFYWTETYRRHLSSRHQLLPYQCRYCSEKFSTSQKLRDHKNEAHEAQMKPYKCNQCEESFKTFDLHLVHIREVHNQKSKYLCSICKADFETQEKLDEHFHRHRIIIKEEPNDNDNEKAKSKTKTKTTKFRCDYCSKLFTKTSDLKRHALVHTGEKPFGCKICDQKFQQRNNLQKHMITVHAERKNFTCDICGKTFGRQDSMLRHMLVHSMEKPFTCQECKKNFARQSQLDTHLKRFHANGKIDLKTEI